MEQTFCSVYGPVQSWRYGRSLGIDPIGIVSTCSFDCVYCQLGSIEHKTRQRQIFIPTQQILQDLQAFAPWDVDAITLSGSGEPTLALNLAEIITQIKAVTGRSVGVLTNGSLLDQADVRAELALADQVAVKVDAITPDKFRRVDRPVTGIELEAIWQGLCQFRQHYRGELAIQTMLLTPWSEAEQQAYMTLMQQIRPDEIQLNTPTRPKPHSHELAARGNATDNLPYPTQSLKCVSAEVLQQFGDRIFAATGIPVRYPPQLSRVT